MIFIREKLWTNLLKFVLEKYAVKMLPGFNRLRICSNNWLLLKQEWTLGCHNPRRFVEHFIVIFPQKIFRKTSGLDTSCWQRTVAEISHVISYTYSSSRQDVSFSGVLNHQQHRCENLKTHFLGPFAKLRKATISFVMSVCPSSVHGEQLGSHWTDSDKTWYLSLFRKSAVKIQVSLKSNKNSGYFT